MIITINNIEINKYELLHLINNGKKIHAIKIVKTKTSMGLKECKDVIDNLSDNPDFYDGNAYISQKSFVENYEETLLKKPKRGSHIIETKSNTKNYIIPILLLGIIILLYMYMSK